MANLLPEQETRSMKGRYRDRFVLAGALVLISTALIAGLLLLPSYMVLSIAESGDESAVLKAREDKQGIQEITKSQALLKEVNTILAASSSPSFAITQAVALRPKGIKITSVSYSPGKPSIISVSGIGANRDVISSFRDVLLSDKHFMSVSIPVSAFVNAEEDSGFSATISSTY